MTGVDVIIDAASAGLLSQHLLDRELADEEKTFDVDGNERPQIVDRAIRIRARSRFARFVLKHQPLDLFTASSLVAQGFLNLPFIPTVHQKKPAAVVGTTLFSLRKQNQNQPAHQTNRNDPERIKLAMNRSLRKCYRCFDYVL